MKKIILMAVLAGMLCANTVSAEMLTENSAEAIRNNMMVSSNSLGSTDKFSDISSVGLNKEIFVVSNGEVDVTVVVYKDENHKTSVVNMSAPISEKALRYIPKVVRYVSESIELMPEEKESLLDANTIYPIGEPSVGLASGAKSKRLKKSIFLMTDYDMKENISMSFLIKIDDYKKLKNTFMEARI